MALKGLAPGCRPFACRAQIGSVNQHGGGILPHHEGKHAEHRACPPAGHPGPSPTSPAAAPSATPDHRLLMSPLSFPDGSAAGDRGAPDPFVPPRKHQDVIKFSASTLIFIDSPDRTRTSPREEDGYVLTCFPPGHPPGSHDLPRPWSGPLPLRPVAGERRPDRPQQPVPRLSPGLRRRRRRSHHLPQRRGNVYVQRVDAYGRTLWGPAESTSPTTRAFTATRSSSPTGPAAPSSPSSGSAHGTRRMYGRSASTPRATCSGERRETRCAPLPGASPISVSPPTEPAAPSSPGGTIAAASTTSTPSASTPSASFSGPRTGWPSAPPPAPSTPPEL